MNTFADLITLGDAAAAADQPLVANWIQMRAGIYMFGCAAGGLENVKISSFGARYPERFEDLSPEACDLFPGSGAYISSRTAILRLLAMLGHIEDPWEALRMLIREAGRKDIEHHWGALKTPAVEAGLAPSDIRADWVWSLDAEARVGHRRTRLRRAVTLLNELFGVEQVAVSGLLPPEPIGPPPVYDRQGRLRVDLPPTLARYQSGIEDPARQGLPQVSRAMCASGRFDLPVDPTADDLLDPATWSIIQALPQRETGYAETTWRLCMTRARSALLPHAVDPIPERLPARYETMISSRADRWPIQALWRRLIERKPELLETEPGKVLDLAIWRELWRDIPAEVTSKTWAAYEGRARQILARHSNASMDPCCLVSSAWTDLPEHAESALDPIRKTADRALLRPLDLTQEWITQQDPSPARREEILGMLREVFYEAAQVHHPEPLQSPSAVAWESLRAAIKTQGISTVGLCKIATPAIRDGLGPSDLSRGWAVAAAAGMDPRPRAKFAIELRKLDSLLAQPELATLLYAKPVGALPDARKCGKIEPPEAMLSEADAVTAVHSRAASTRREARATVRKLWTAAMRDTGNLTITTLVELLSAAATLDVDDRTRRKAARLLNDLHSAQKAG